MKTSMIEVRDMLSVLGALGLEKRIGAVPGVDSVTVNYAAGSATVRYDETRLGVADIQSTHAPTQENSVVAERVGFEPTVRFPAHTLSKRAP